jgi:tRNA U34 5-methylaminomethyl-2-thiouridine-forming methyltransferase MnmC
MLVFENRRFRFYSKKSLCSPNGGTYGSGRGRLGKRNVPRICRWRKERVLNFFLFSKNFQCPTLQNFRDFQGLRRKKFIAAERLVVRPRTRYRWIGLDEALPTVQHIGRSDHNWPRKSERKFEIRETIFPTISLDGRS